MNTSENINELQQIEKEAMAILAESPFYFKLSKYTAVIPLLSIDTIEVSSGHKPLPPLLDFFMQGKEYPTLKVRAAKESYEISADEGRILMEKIRRLPSHLKP